MEHRALAQEMRGQHPVEQYPHQGYPSQEQQLSVSEGSHHQSQPHTTHTQSSTEMRPPTQSHDQQYYQHGVHGNQGQSHLPIQLSSK